MTPMEEEFAARKAEGEAEALGPRTGPKCLTVCSEPATRHPTVEAEDRQRV